MSFGFGDFIAAMRSGVLIKSVQYGTVAFAAGEASVTAVISSVNTAKTLLTFLGYKLSVGTTYAGDTRNFQDYLPMITLTNATTVTMSRISDTNTAVLTASFCVVEYY